MTFWQTIKIKAPELIPSLKAMLYKIAKSVLDKVIRLMLKYRYPDIKDMVSLQAFILELIDICRSYDTKGQTNLQYLKDQLIYWLYQESKQESAVFIQDEREFMLLSELTHLYQVEIYTWINSLLVLDNEADIIISLGKFDRHRS